MQSKSNLTHLSENRDTELMSNGLLLFLTESVYWLSTKKARNVAKENPDLTSDVNGLLFEFTGCELSNLLKCCQFCELEANIAYKGNSPLLFH